MESIRSKEAGFSVGSTPADDVLFEGVPGVSREDKAGKPLGGALGTSRKLHEGSLGMTRPGHPKEQRHFVLYRDRLVYFALCSEAGDWGIQAEGTIQMADVEDFEILDTSFVLHMRGGASITLHQTSAGGLDKWLEAFTSIFADDDTEATTQQSAKARPYTFDESADCQVYEGQLQHGTGDCWDCRHARLCSDSLDFFQGRAEAESGASPIDSIGIESIMEVEVTENGFDLRLVGSVAVQCLRAAGPQEFEEWMTAWSQVLSSGFQPKTEGCGWMREEDFLEAAPTDSPAGPICEGDVTVLNCKSWSTPRQQHFVVYADRLEHYDDAECAANNLDCQGRILTQDVRSVRVRDDAFHFGLDDHDLIVRVPDSGNMESWITVLQSVLEPQKHGLDSGDSEDKEEVPTMKPVLLSAGEPVMAEGSLGFQHEGRLVRRYCRLFGDRLDAWASTVTYEKRHAPVQRLLLKDVWGIELIGGGFVLNHRGSKMGVHVGAIEDLRAWAAAMLSVLSLSQSSAAKLAEHIRTHVNQMPHTPLSLSNGTPSPVTASPGVASNLSSLSSPSPVQPSPGTTSNPSAATSPPRSPPQKKVGPHWVPRVAGLTKSASAPKATTSKLDPAKMHQGRNSMVRGGSLFVSKHPESRDHNSRGAGTLDSMRMLHRPVSPKHAKREVDEKINAHVPGVQLRRSSNMADKVTGTDRALSPRRSTPWDKIAHAGAKNEGHGVRHRGGGSAELTKVTGKVTEPGRVAIPSVQSCLRSPRSAGVTEKI